MVSGDGGVRRHVPGSGAGADAAGDGGSGSISQEPVSILFAPHSAVERRDVWEIDLIQILEILAGILERSGRKRDLRIAGMAAFASSLIYKKKVESIFALHKTAMERKPISAVRREYPDIETINIPYRHEPMYPVSLDDLLGVLQSLMDAMASPNFRAGRRSLLEPSEPPAFEDYLLSLEGEIDAYRNMIMDAVAEAGSCILQDMADGLDALESVRCFFAALFLARDGLVDLVQEGDDIRIVAMPQTATGNGDCKDGGDGGRGGS